MTIDDLKEILDMIREHQVVEFELDRDGVRLRIRKDSLHAPALAYAPVAVPAPQPVAAVPAMPSASVSLPAGGATPADGGPDGVELAVVKSPIVGTFYRTPSPGAQPFVEVGTLVKKGQVLCIIEAMKLMNEIECEYEGEIVKVFVENGQPVQYGERLFAIKAK
ncbi:MAG: acetyl-CoA carboxylase biotin carboxyl carrier protein [Vicinamibacterales bacterium]